MYAILFSLAVPSENSSGTPRDKLAITSFYLLFGMALIAMAFNLAQEEVVNMVSRFAVRLGIYNPNRK